VPKVTLRAGTSLDADALHALVTEHLQEGHLLPRDRAEIARHAGRFVVAEANGKITACAELAPLSTDVAEIRSLVVAGRARGNGLAGRMVDYLRDRAESAGIQKLCAFTHDPRLFVRMGFSLVPHLWLPEKIAKDCLSCPLFRKCGQEAVLLPLAAAALAGAAAFDARHAAVA